MSHVDDGQLHAYLDGAYAPGGEQGERIASHLESCVDCRVRLEDARELREKAGLVMRHAAPAAAEAPSFDTILERARAQRETRGPAFVPTGSATTTARPERAAPRSWRRMPLAWAASLVMALAAGWLASDLFSRYGGDAPRDASAPAELDALDEASRDAQFETLQRLDAAAGADDQASGEREQGQAGAGGRSAASAEADAAVANRARAQPPAVAGAPPVAGAVPPPANIVAEPPVRQAAAPPANVAANAAEERRAAEQRVDTQSVAARAAANLGMVQAMEFSSAMAADTVVLIYAAADAAASAPHPPDWAMALAERAAAASEGSRWMTLTEEAAAQRLGATPVSLLNATRHSLAIDESEGEPVVRAVFDLGGGRTAEVIQRAAPAAVLADAAGAVDLPRAERAAAPPPPATPELPVRARLEQLFGERSAIAVRRPELWILLTAPLPADSLYTLVNRVR